MVLALAVQAAAGAEYVGSQVCAGCHAAKWKQQSASQHAFALRRAGEHPLRASFAQAAPGYAIQGTGAGFAAQVSEAVIPIQWAFGAGDQAVTFVSQLDEATYLEHRFSLYSQDRKLALTPGHPAIAERKPASSGGVVYKTFAPGAEIMKCFGCHSTGALSLGPAMEIVPAEAGVHCEACHGPGAAHAADMRAGNSSRGRAAIQNPGRMSAAAVNEFCGNCHRMPAGGDESTNWSNPWNVRHQPIYLAQSACFRKSAGALSCLTCHDAHQPLRRDDPAPYNQKCRSCHKAVNHPASLRAATFENCIACHMPGVAPRERLTFANHWIGVFAPGNGLKPVSRR